MIFRNIKIVILYKYFVIKSRNISDRHNENNNRHTKIFGLSVHIVVCIWG